MNSVPCKHWITLGKPFTFRGIYRYAVCTPVTESREYGNPIPSQNTSLSNNYNITSAVHNCMCAFQFARKRYARTLRTADMLTLFCKLRKTKNF